jgi:PKD repeat protein
MERRWIILPICIGLILALINIVAADEIDITCNPEVALPEGPIQFVVMDGIESYFDITINTPAADVGDGPYAGWCVEKSEQMTRGQNHTAILYSSYDLNMPDFFKGVGGLELWHKINFFLNNVNYIFNEIGNESCTVNKDDIQDAIWNICCGVTYENISLCAQFIIDYLNDPSHEDEIFGYCPQIGDKIIILIDTYSSEVNVQHTILELPIVDHSEEEDEPDQNPSHGGIVLSGNTPPTADGSMGAPYQGVIEELLLFDGSRSYDYDGDIVEWNWSFGDNTYDLGEIVTHMYEEPGIYTLILKVTDDEGSVDTYTTSVRVTQPNRAPNKPEISGETYCDVVKNYIYTAVSIDPDNDTVRYIFEWGDGGSNTITSFVQNNTTITINRIWNEAGLFLMKVFAEDEYNVPSDTYQTFVYIDVDVIFIDDLIEGYLIDYGRDGAFETFHNNETGDDVNVSTNEEGLLLIDSDDDGEWNWFYGENTGLEAYAHPDDKGAVSSLSFGSIFLILLIVVGIIVLLVYIIRRR